MLVWFSNLSIALLTGCVMSVLLSSVIYCNFHLLHDLLLHLYIYLVSYYFVIRYYIFIFIYKRNLIHNFLRVSEKKSLIFLQSVLMWLILLESRLSKKVLRSRLYNLLQYHFCFHISFYICLYDSWVLFLKHIFSNWDLFIIGFLNALIT